MNILWFVESQFRQLRLDLVALNGADLQPHVPAVLRYPLAQLDCTELANLTRQKCC